jgi:hypothetical protein
MIMMIMPEIALQGCLSNSGYVKNETTNNPPRKLQRIGYTGPVTILNYQKFELVREPLGKEDINLPLSTAALHLLSGAAHAECWQSSKHQGEIHAMKGQLALLFVLHLVFASIFNDLAIAHSS